MFCVGCNRAMSRYSCRLSRSGGQQRIESGDAALSHYRDVHAARYGRLSLRAKVPGKVTEVVVFIDGAPGSEDKTWRFVKQLLSLVVQRPATGHRPPRARAHNPLSL